MYVKKTYIAEDGKEFQYELQCRAYEANLYEKLYASTLHPFIALFNKGGKPAFFYFKDIEYVYVKQVPDWENEEFMDIWSRIIPTDLTDVIENHGEGWYFRGDCDNWYSWTKQEKMHKKMKQNFSNMYKMLDNQ